MKQKGFLSRTTEETKNNVIELYQKGHSQNYIESALCMTRRTIRAILEQENIKRTKLEQTFYYHVASTLRENVFDVVSDDMAYWLGFMYADGYVTNPEKRFSLGVLLKESDRAHIEKLKEFLKAPQDIYHDEKHKNVRLMVGSQRLHSALMRWGFTHNKSYDAVPPEVMKYNRHFWRGVVDGDGYLGTVKEIPRLHLCGTRDMIEAFRIFLTYSGIDTDAQTRKHPKNNLHMFEIGAVLAVGAAKLLYEDSRTYLDRKFEVYQGWLNTKYNFKGCV